jgi:hypothetical protein
MEKITAPAAGVLDGTPYIIVMEFDAIPNIMSDPHDCILTTQAGRRVFTPANGYEVNRAPRYGRKDAERIAADFQSRNTNRHYRYTYKHYMDVKVAC